jgi:hypothetical protein
MKKETEEVIMNFLVDRIITRFGSPAKITTNNEKSFSSLALEKLCFKYGIVLSHSSNYYPQGNGLVESNKKNIMNILKKIIGENKKGWDNKIMYALWADCTTTKTSTWKTSFELVYELESKFPSTSKYPSFSLCNNLQLIKTKLQGRIDQLIELDKSRRCDFDQMERNQDNIKGTFDHKERQRNFE